jgi:hypothetical protein
MGHKATLEVVLDCEEPKRLAEFWREALDYRDYNTDANLAVLVPKKGSLHRFSSRGSPNPKRARTAFTSTLWSKTSRPRSTGYRHSACVASTRACKASGAPDG